MKKTHRQCRREQPVHPLKDTQMNEQGDFAYLRCDSAAKQRTSITGIVRVAYTPPAKRVRKSKIRRIAAVAAPPPLYLWRQDAMIGVSDREASCIFEWINRRGYVKQCV